MTGKSKNENFPSTTSNPPQTQHQAPQEQSQILSKNQVLSNISSDISSEAPTEKIPRQKTFDSVSTAMDSTSTAPTSPLPSGVANGLKSDENANPKPPSPDASQLLTVPNDANEANPQAAKATVPQLSKPKTEHMQYYLNSLDQPSRGGVSRFLSKTNGNKTPDTPSSGDTSKVIEGNDASEMESIQKSQENSDDKSPQLGSLSSPTSEQVLDASSNVAVLGSNVGDRVLNPPDEKRSRVPSISFSLLRRKRTKSTETPVPVPPVIRAVRAHSPTESSPPISIISGSARCYQEGTDSHVVDGVDTRNEATWRRDLMTDFENRKLQGRHEHPFEGSTALHQKSNIKNIGLKQLMRSLGTVVRKSTHHFKKLVLRRAKTIPNQFSAVVHGNIHNLPAPQPLPNPKLVTRNQRIEEYKVITSGALPTFGPRVCTPPPIPPLSRRGSAEITHQESQPNGIKNPSSNPQGNPQGSSNNGIIVAPQPIKADSKPNGSQNGLFASKAEESTGNLNGKPELANGNHYIHQNETYPSTNTGHTQNPYDGYQDVQMDAQGTPRGSAGALDCKSTPKSAGIEGEFVQRTFQGW